MTCHVAFRYPCPKDSDETLDYQFDWTAAIAGETIASQSVSVSGVTLVATAIDGTSRKVNMRLTGGVANTTAEIEGTITTQSGQVLQRTAKLKIKSR